MCLCRNKNADVVWGVFLDRSVNNSLPRENISKGQWCNSTAISTKF